MKGDQDYEGKTRIARTLRITMSITISSRRKLLIVRPFVHLIRKYRTGWKLLCKGSESRQLIKKYVWSFKKIPVEQGIDDPGAPPAVTVGGRGRELGSGNCNRDAIYVHEGECI